MRMVTGALTLFWCLVSPGVGADPVVSSTQLVSASGAPAATTQNFTIATATDLVVTFTDLQLPSPLNSANVLVTQGSALVATSSLAPPATSATLALPGAVGAYVIRVIGTPNASAGIGTFSVCVAPKPTPSACIADASFSGNISVQSAPASPTLSTQATTLTVTTAGAYTFTYGDLQFPVALASPPNLALFQGSQTVAAPIPASPATISLSPGTYTLLALAEADPTTVAGLYGVTVTGPGGVVLVGAAYPVGALSPATNVTNSSTQSLSLAVTDFAFPGALASASALVTAQGSMVAAAGAGTGPASFSAPQGTLQVWNYGASSGSTAGTYEVDLKSASASLSQAAFGVGDAATLAYAFDSPAPLTAGTYQLTANDFQFPAALTGVQFAVVQNGVILEQSATLGTVPFTATAGPVIVLIAATPAGGSNGLVDVNVQTSASTPQLVFDKVQPVTASGSGFISQAINLGVSGNFDVNLTDLKFPAALSNLALVSTSAGNVLGKIYGGGTFSVSATPGNYDFTVVAIPATAQQYGLYGLEVVAAPPTVTLSASPTSVPQGALTTLSWTVTNATSCTASGGAFTGSQSVTSGSAAVAVAATTTYTLTCTGAGGSASGTAMVTATPVIKSSSGGGALAWSSLVGLALLVLIRRPR